MVEESKSSHLGPTSSKLEMNSTEQIAANEQNALHIQTLLETDGTLGSPIDLDIARMNVIELDPLKWIGMDVPPRKLKVTNTGFTVIVSAKWQDERPCLTGGPFQGRYIFGQIHFHWGKNEMNGSDHTIDGASAFVNSHKPFQTNGPPASILSRLFPILGSHNNNAKCAQYSLDNLQRTNWN
ncbi:Carbonic anhydrase 7 [Eufriesea mexicana]|uniref:Carbonic anhydrase 7 n=1 Tax=Eufriesea mexicana TaxID=516756 RepID=A0A310SKV7_9HYME|nr:Carbonic anhydrase 7 [Eufriesea mexicana]